MRDKRSAAVVIATLSLACSGSPFSSSSSESSVTSSGSLVFRASPLETSTIQAIIPLGNLNPPGHTLPTNHIYVNNRAIGAPPVSPQPVFAPADGVAQFIVPNGVEPKLGVSAGSFTYYLDHLQLDPAVATGTRVSAGQRLGVTGTVAHGIDFGVINQEVTLPFVNPARYSAESLHGDAPLRFYEEPLRSRLYALVAGIGDKDGKFQYDARGRLAGNWFLEGLAPSQSETEIGWPQQLAFVFDNYDPSSVRVSIGGTLALVGAFAVEPDAADPRDMSPATGTVTYQLRLAGGPGQPAGAQLGIMIVQMLADDRLRAEVVPGAGISSADFTAASRVYLR